VRPGSVETALATCLEPTDVLPNLGQATIVLARARTTGAVIRNRRNCLLHRRRFCSAASLTQTRLAFPAGPA